MKKGATRVPKLDERQSYTTNDGVSRARFREEIVARDDGFCIVTAKVSQVCHIIPHVKGDDVRSKNLSLTVILVKYLDFPGNNRLRHLERPLLSIGDPRNLFAYRSSCNHRKLHHSFLPVRATHLIIFQSID